MKSDDCLLLGAHLSIDGGVHKAIDRAQELGINALQIFTHNVRSWKDKQFTQEEISTFKKAKNNSDVEFCVIHTSYLINLASPQESLWEKSKQGILSEIRRASQLGINYITTHIGAHTGSGESAGLSRVIQALKEISSSQVFRTSEVKILLENTAGQGTSLGHSPSQLGQLLHNVKTPERFGFCFDTCHAFAAGYDLSTKAGVRRTIDQFRNQVKEEKLKLIHLNDCKGQLGSGLDRHEHIGKGNIGLSGFEYLINHPDIRHLPLILETPKEEIDGTHADVINLSKIRQLRQS